MWEALAVTLVLRAVGVLPHALGGGTIPLRAETYL